MTREQRLARTALLMSPAQMERLAHAHVMLLGLGGVGGHAAEALARGGVGRMTIVDHDTVSPSNLNRQLVALESTIGLPKTQVMYRRLKDAAPDLDLTAIDAFYLPDSPVPIPEDATVVVDAIDTASAKLHLARVCRERGVPLISCMGMGNRLDPAQIRVGDIFETSGCPLCRVMRQGLRKLGVPSLRCVYIRWSRPVIRGRERGLNKRAGILRPDRSASCLRWRASIWQRRPFASSPEKGEKVWHRCGVFSLSMVK